MDRSALESVITSDKSVIAYASLVVAIGLIGEYWKDVVKVWDVYWGTYPLTIKVLWSTVGASAVLFFPTLVVLGVAVEWLFEADVSVREAAHTVLLDAENVRLANAAKAATERAADAEKKASDLLAENVELERALAPREFNQATLSAAVSTLPRVPIFVAAVNREEPREIAGYVISALNGVSSNGAATWSVTGLPLDNWGPEGITIEYVKNTAFTSQNPDKSSEQVATAICESLKSENLSVTMRGDTVGVAWYKDDWPKSAPDNSVIISVGIKPNHFWFNKQMRAQGKASMQIDDASFCTSDEFFEWARKRDEEWGRQLQHESPK